MQSSKGAQKEKETTDIGDHEQAGVSTAGTVISHEQSLDSRKP